MNTKKIIISVVVAVIGLFLVASFGKIAEDVNVENIVVNQYPMTGKMAYWTTPGLRWQWFGRTTTYFKTQQLWFGAEDENKRQMGNPIPVIFNDASEGLIYGSLRVKLPSETKYLERIQTDYNGMDRLMTDLVRPTVVKVIYASGPLMSAFESYAEKKNELIDYITDQLNNGVYKTSVKHVEVIDQFTNEKKMTKIATLVADENSPGGYVRSESSPFAYYGLEIGQVSLAMIDYADKVKLQIAQQQESNMLIQTSKAQAVAAQQEAIRLEEVGKAQAMQAKWEQEKIKVVEVTKARQRFEVAELAAKEAIENAKKVKAQGEAEAAAARAKVAAGLTPQEAAEWKYKTAVGVAEALAKSSVRWVPEVMISGKGDSNFNPLDAVGYNYLLETANKVSARK